MGDSLRRGVQRPVELAQFVRRQRGILVFRGDGNGLVRLAIVRIVGIVAGKAVGIAMAVT